jgi:large subunit ribosomal protein L21e
MSGKKAKGKRSKTRSLLRRNVRAKTTVNEIIKPIKVGDTVQVNINSSKHEGLPHKRMYGKTGNVINFQGKSPVIEIYDGNLKKKVITHRVHLKQIKQIPKQEKVKK